MFKALYIHIPFCTSRCAYCDFATAACHDDVLMDAYVDVLCLQLRRASKAGLLGDVRTIYLGGGTPTHLGSRRLNSLAYMISLSVNLEQVVEYTVEANPESLTAAMVKDLYALGVNRLSIGVQSFDDAVLRVFGRPHNACDIALALACAKERAMSMSVDLICGAPGQSRESWRDSVKRAIDAGVGHVSIYPLTVEEGTPLAAMVEAGQWGGPSDDDEAAMMEDAQEILCAAGFARYEVASYAKPGCESKHNSAYWTGEPYLGLGAAAASMMSPTLWAACTDAQLFGDPVADEDLAAAQVLVADATDNGDDGACGSSGRIRIQAAADTAAYISSMGRPAWSADVMDARVAVLEDVMLAFRRSAGLDRGFAARALKAVPQLADVLRTLQEEGLVARAGDGSYVPTQRGWLMGNRVFGAIWDLA